jgi:hypothetical protein
MSREAIRDYISGPHDGAWCSCKHDGTKWTARCVAAAANDHAEAARWARDRVLSTPHTVFTPEHVALAAEASPAYQAFKQAYSNEDLR